MTGCNTEQHSDKEDDSRGVEFVDEETVEHENELLVEDKIETEKEAEPTEDAAGEDDIIDLGNDEQEPMKEESETEQLAVANDDIYVEHEDDAAVAPQEVVA